MLDTPSLKHFEANEFISLNPEGSDLYQPSCIFILRVYEIKTIQKVLNLEIPDHINCEYFFSKFLHSMCFDPLKIFCGPLWAPYFFKNIRVFGVSVIYICIKSISTDKITNQFLMS